MKRLLPHSLSFSAILWLEWWPSALLWITSAVGVAVILWRAWRVLQAGRAWLIQFRANRKSPNPYKTLVLGSRDASDSSDVDTTKQTKSEREYEEEKKQRALANLLRPELNQMRDSLGQLEAKISSIDGMLADVRVELRNMVAAAGYDRSTSLLNSEPTGRQQDASTETAGAKRSRSVDAIPLSYDSLCENGLGGFESDVVFAGLDIDGSSTTKKRGEVIYRFKTQDSKQSAFVIFEGRRDDALLFPNPVISFTEAMGYVFHDLSHDNFETKKRDVHPVRIRRLSSTAWEMMVED